MTTRKAASLKRIRYFISWCLLALGIVALLKMPELGRRFISASLDTCIRSVIPAVFPAAVIGSLLSRTEPPAFIARPLSKFFGIPSAGASAVITGLFSGFPTGAICTVNLLKSGRIRREDAERMICYVSAPSAAFIVGTVGSAVLGSVRAGAALLIFQTVFSVGTGFILGRGRSKETEPAAGSARMFGLRDISSAIRDAALAMLNITAFVTAFSLIGGYISAFINSGIMSVLVSGLLEIGNGAAGLFQSGMSHSLRFPIAGVFVGWSGFSAHMQVFSVCADQGIGMKKYFICKLISALATGLFCAVCLIASGSISAQL